LQIVIARAHASAHFASMSVPLTLLGLLEREPSNGGEAEPGGGPDRKLYAITTAGAAVVGAWLTEPAEPGPHLDTALFAKVRMAARADSEERVTIRDRVGRLSAGARWGLLGCR
jgi:hypothetical protein